MPRGLVYEDVSITGNLFIGKGSSVILFMGSNKAVRNAVFGVHLA